MIAPGTDVKLTYCGTVYQVILIRGEYAICGRYDYNSHWFGLGFEERVIKLKFLERI